MGRFVYGLVALNRKLGFPSREIDIQWKKGKQPENVALFNLYVVLFQSEWLLNPLHPQQAFGQKLYLQERLKMRIPMFVHFCTWQTPLMAKTITRVFVNQFMHIFMSIFVIGIWLKWYSTTLNICQAWNATSNNLVNNISFDLFRFINERMKALSLW
jgi:hypothetical protein